MSGVIICLGAVVAIGVVWGLLREIAEQRRIGKMAESMRTLPHTAGGSGCSRVERQGALGGFTPANMIAPQERIRAKGKKA